MADTKINFVQISVGNNATVTNALYANGKQQCTVTIQIRKVVEIETKPDVWEWVKEPLSANELKSLTILPWSDQLRPSQAPGWECRDKQNEYTQGLRGGSRAAAPEEAEAAPMSNEAPQIVYRYMETTRAQSQRFMACVTLDDFTLDDGTVIKDKKYSTNYQLGKETFNSHVEILPQNPYVIRVADLRATRSDAYTYEYKKNNWIDVDVYYWDLPGGLRIQSESFTGAGYWGSKLQYAYARNESKLLVGAAIMTGITSLTLGDIGTPPSGVSPSTVVPISGDGRTVLRALRDLEDGMTTSPTYNNQLRWTIIDNYGCQSTFILSANPADKGNTVVLSNG